MKPDTGLDLAVAVGGEDHVRGPADAPVTLVEYADFQCPYCAAASRRLPAVMATNRVRLVIRHFALSEVHGRAEATALAAEAAARQDRFWEMHDRLFAHQDRLGDNDLLDHARALHLDLDAFRAALEDDDLLRRVDDDRDGGERSGVRGTPTFFVNGRRYDRPWAPMLSRLATAANGGGAAA
jgi:NhaA family Na+:H+ antiporter